MRVVVLILLLFTLFTGFEGWLLFPKGLIGSSHCIVSKGPSRYPVVVDYNVLLTSRCSGLNFLNHSSSAVTLCWGAVWGDGDLLEVCTVIHLLGVYQYL